MDVASWIYVGLEIAGLLGGVVAATAAVVWWFARHTRLSRADFADWLDGHVRVHETLERRLDSGEKRFGALDGDIRDRADQHDLQLIRDIVAELQGALRERVAIERGITERLSHMESQLDRLIDFHLTGGK